MDTPKPHAQHELLSKLVGDWTFQASCDMGPDKPRETFNGTESVRSLGGLWTICEGEGESPMGKSQMVMTLGFDPIRNRFVGTFIASMMTHLWVYDGALDATGKVITLDTQGPDFADPTQLKPYRDTITIISDDERTLTSQMPGPDGKWVEFMKSEYRRVKK